MFAVERDGFHVSVAGDEQEAVPGFEKIRAGVIEARPPEQPDQRMILDLVRRRHRAASGIAGGGLRDHAHGAIDDGVLHEAFAGEGSIIARRPHGLTEILIGDERSGGRTFFFPVERTL